MDLFYIADMSEMSQFCCVVFTPKAVRAQGAPAVFMGTIEEASKMDEGTAEAICDLLNKEEQANYRIQKWVSVEKRASF